MEVSPSPLPPSPPSNTLIALSLLRLALPCTILLLLFLRFSARAFTSLIAHIQAQGWVESAEQGYGPLDDVAEPAEEGEDGVTPVVVRVRKVRRGLVLGSCGAVAGTYVVDGVAQIISICITKTWTPSSPLYLNIIPYVVGGLASFALCAIAMGTEERWAKENGKWGKVYPRVVAVVAWGMELVILVLFVIALRDDPSTRPSITPLPSIHLAVLSLRLLLLTSFLLSQTPLFYSSIYLPAGASSTEETSLLGRENGTTSSTTYGTTKPPPSKPHPLRSSKAPSNRPPDPKSLSILTLFSRVYTLFPYLWPSKSFSLQILALICIGLMLFRRALNVFVPILFGNIISDLSAGRPPYTNVVLYSLASFARDSNSMLYRYLWLPIEQYSEREMNNMSFDCLLNLSLGYHTRRKTGELLRILGRSDAINNFFETLIFTFVPIIIDLPVAAVVLSVRFGGLIVLIVMAVSSVYVGTSITLAESRTKLYRKLRDESQFMHQIKTDTLFNYETVKTFTAESFERERLDHAMRVYQRGYFRVYSAWNSLSLIQQSISSFGFLVCSFILAHRIVEGTMDVGDYVTFVNYLAQLYSPLGQIASLYRTTMNQLVDTEQLIELLNEEKDIVDREDAQELSIVGDNVDGDIVFDDVRFTYDKKVDTVKGVTFTVPKGHSVALVGPSGGGKSTIMRLLYRFYDVTGGSIKIGGKDIRDVTQTSLRHAIGLVPQESVLFNETARYNIAYGGGVTTTEEAIIEAAKSASIHDRIMSFPDQYETRVGERGQRLSGGEKQRVAIARVLLKDPPILLLDEATSSLDTNNERQIQARLRELSKGRTTLAIAHRLSTVVDCDTIYVLSEGGIAESGSHSELLAQGGVYADLWAKQIEGQEGLSAPASGTVTPVTK